MVLRRIILIRDIHLTRRDDPAEISQIDGGEEVESESVRDSEVRDK